MKFFNFINIECIFINDESQINFFLTLRDVLMFLFKAVLLEIGF
jgi:hypothetical protein